MKKTEKELIIEWLNKYIPLEEFYGSDCSNEEFRDFYAYEIEKFHDKNAHSVPIIKWLDRNYSKDKEQFFYDHEKQAMKYYNQKW